jgi:hypothetical protein
MASKKKVVKKPQKVKAVGGNQRRHNPRNILPFGRPAK